MRLLSAAAAGEYEDGIEVARELNLALPEDQYGSNTAYQANGEVSRTSIDVDAYLHPIVRAYRFEEAVEMFHQAGLSCCCVNGVNRKGQSKLLDLGENSRAPYFCLKPDEIFRSPLLVERFRALPLRQKLRVIEIAWNPTGFTCVGGKGQSFRRCGEQIVAGALK